MRLRINTRDKNASNARNKVITDTCGKKLVIPLDFEMLDSMMIYPITSRGSETN